MIIATMMFRTVVFASGIGSISKKANKDGYYEITVSTSYLNTTKETIIQLPEDLTKRGIETVTLSTKDTFIPIFINLNKNILTITPSINLVDGTTYTAKIFLFR